MKTFTGIIFISFTIFLYIAPLTPQSLKFRSGIFFHHSTGECIWGPNGSNTSIPQQMVIYNNNHGYTGTNAVTMSELWWPAEDDNEWWRWHRIFKNQDTAANIQPFYASSRIIVVKSCFPSSNVEAWGVPGDTSDPDYKTVMNYKWHWRNIVKVMRSHPQNFFVIWTNAPLVPNETNTTEAWFSHCFCKWAKDTLAAGLDPLTGSFPQNIYVFDFFHKLVGSNWMMLLSYASGPYDSHPNAAATQLVAPQFVNEIFNASINYEQTYGIKQIHEYAPGYYLNQNYPNPFNPSTKIRFGIPLRMVVSLEVFSTEGKRAAVLYNGMLNAGEYESEFSGTALTSGIYFYRIKTDDFSESKKMILIK
jgi:hypothetical protein